MKLIKPSFEIIDQPSGLEGMYKQIELVGRVSHKSEDRITEDSSKEFVDRMIKLGHGAVLEHGTVYLKYDIIEHGSMNLPNKYHLNKYSVVTVGNELLHGYETSEYKEKFDGHTYAYITTNYRVLLQNDWLDDLKYLCEPTEFHEKRVCVKFICDRGVLAEFTRHRKFSFMAESTRYCNYSKDKFGNELTFIKPCFLDDEKLSLYGPYHTVIRDKSPESIFIANLNNAEKDYLDLIESGWNPQQARAVLPNALKTELYMTGFISDWKHFFLLRTPMNAHPQARELAIPLLEEFKKRNLI